MALAAGVLGVLPAVACGGGSPEDGGAPEGEVAEEASRAASAAPAADSSRVAGEIAAMLHASARAWNAGHLEGFVDDYLESPEMTFIGGSGVVRGREEVRARYESSYWAPGAERDSLRFEDLEIRPLGERHALALGRYVLHRPPADTTTATGWFTLVLRRGPAGTWKIVHDHSS